MASDPAAVHREFSTRFFGEVWGLLDKTDRTSDDDERMISTCHASLAHWRLRADCGPRELSIGYWQLARVYAVLRQAENARHYGSLCLAVSAAQPPFFLGYAHESLARAAKMAGDERVAAEHVEMGRKLALAVTDADDRAMLEKDLQELV